MNAEQQAPIIRAGVDALSNVIACIDAVWAHRPAKGPGPPYYIVSEAAVAIALQRLCVDQAQAYACLFDRGTRSSESRRMADARMARVQMVRQRCEGIDLSELANRGVRNALSHFDERYLKALMEYRDGPWLQDIALSHWATISLSEADRARLIRVYVFEDDSLHLFGERLNLGPLRRTCEAAIERLG